jgi:hypothetical protein
MQLSSTVFGTVTAQYRGSNLMDQGLPAYNLFSSLTPGEVCLLDCLHDARHELRQLMERWDKRFTAKRSIAQSYIEGRITVVLDCYFVWSGNRESVASVRSTLVHDYVKEKDAAMVVFGANVGDREHRYYGEQEAVLVDNVQLVQCVEQVVPSTVWLYCVDNEIADDTPCSLYRSLINGAFKFASLLTKRELDFSVVGDANDFVHHKVESRTKVVDSIADEKRSFIRHWFKLHLNTMFPSIWIKLGANSVEIACDELCQQFIEIKDVLIGPFDL